MAEYGISERRACDLLGVSRSQARRQIPEDRNGALRKRLCELARHHPRYGSPALYQVLRREGWLVNRKRVYRLYREEGLGERLKRGKTVLECGASESLVGLVSGKSNDTLDD